MYKIVHRSSSTKKITQYFINLFLYYYAVQLNKLAQTLTVSSYSKNDDKRQFFQIYFILSNEMGRACGAYGGG